MVGKKIVDYYLVCEEEYYNLTKAVYSFLGQGYFPYGSPYGKGNCHCQAMVKYED